MPEPIHLTLPGDSPLARQLAEALRQSADAVACPICGALCPRDQLAPQKQLGREVCPLCHAAADEVFARFREAALRHLHDLKAQLPRIVRDRRAGAEMPTFYAGLDA